MKVLDIPATRSELGKGKATGGDEERREPIDGAHRKLLASILTTAIHDACYEKEYWSYYLADCDVKGAWNWICDESEDDASGKTPFSYAYICEHLGYDPARARKSILQYIEEQREARRLKPFRKGSNDYR